MQVKQRRSRILSELKRVVIDIHCLEQYEIMNKELQKDIKRVAVALEKLVRLMTKLMKEQNDQNKRRNTTS